MELSELGMCGTGLATVLIAMYRHGRGIITVELEAAQFDSESRHAVSALLGDEHACLAHHACVGCVTPSAAPPLLPPCVQAAAAVRASSSSAVISRHGKLGAAGS